MKSQVLTHAALTTILLAGTCARLASAGELTPPSGPPTATMKSLQAIEPRTAIGDDTTPGDSTAVFVLSQAGSYYLTGNVLTPSGQSGIRITAQDVTLDLNGFTIIGAGESKDGIEVAAQSMRVSIRNGSIRFMGERGVDAGSTAEVSLDTIDIRSCAGDGARLGERSIVKTCRATNNAGYGIHAGPLARIDATTAEGNGLSGIAALDRATLTGCSVLNNGASLGYSSLSAGEASILENCIAEGGAGIGIYAEQSSRIVNCVGRRNDGWGIATTYDSTVSGCVSEQNGGYGVYVDLYCTVLENTVTDNGYEGIRVGLGCTVRGNTVGGHGDGEPEVRAGILAASGSNRIEDNNLFSNDIGVRADSAGNFIVRNSLRGNSQAFQVNGVQTIGPSITATGTIASTNPWANFVY